MCGAWIAPLFITLIHRLSSSSLRPPRSNCSCRAKARDMAGDGALQFGDDAGPRASGRSARHRRYSRHSHGHAARAPAPPGLVLGGDGQAGLRQPARRRDPGLVQRGGEKAPRTHDARSCRKVNVCLTIGRDKFAALSKEVRSCAPSITFAAFAALGFSLSGCIAYDVASTAVGAATTVVGTTVDVAGDVVSGAASTVSGSSPTTAKRSKAR